MCYQIDDPRGNAADRARRHPAARSQRTGTQAIESTQHKAKRSHKREPDALDNDTIDPSPRLTRRARKQKEAAEDPASSAPRTSRSRRR